MKMTENKKKLKILYLITKSNWGGAQRYVYDLASSLSNDKFETTVILGGDGILSERLRETDIRVISLPSLERDVNLFKDIKTFFELIRIFKRESPDIIHLNSSKIGGLGTLAARFYNLLLFLPTTNYQLPTRIIFTSHGWAFNEERNLISKTLFWFLYLFIIFLCDTVCVVSENVRNSTPLLTFFNRKIHTIYNGAKEEVLLTRHIAQEVLLGNNRSGPVVGSMGELHKSKGYKYLIGAVEKLKNTFPSIKLVILGEGEERENLERIIREKNLADRVILKGFVDHSARYLKAFDVFVLSSITEALGYVVLEAGLAEVPVVATRIGGVPEIIINEKIGVLVTPRNEDALASGIKKMIEDKNYANLCALNLKNRVSQEFSLNRMREKTYDIYR